MCVTVYLQCDEVGVKVNTNDIGRRVKEVKVARVHPCNKQLTTHVTTHLLVYNGAYARWRTLYSGANLKRSIHSDVSATYRLETVLAS